MEVNWQSVKHATARSVRHGKVVHKLQHSVTLAKFGSETNKLRLWLWSMKAPLFQKSKYTFYICMHRTTFSTNQTQAEVSNLSAAMSITERCLISQAVLYLIAESNHSANNRCGVLRSCTYTALMSSGSCRCCTLPLAAMMLCLISLLHILRSTSSLRR